MLGCSRRRVLTGRGVIPARSAVSRSSPFQSRSDGGPEVNPGLLLQGRSRRLLIAAIFTSIAMIAMLDLLTSSELIASILFTLPLALCALQSSKRLLWTVAALVGALTIASGEWGPFRAGVPATRDELISRAFLVVALLTLSLFIHLWLRRARLGWLLAQVEAARYRGLLEAAPDAMIVVDQAGAIVLLNVQAEKTFGYRHDDLIGQPVTNIIPEGFAERLIADDARTAAEALAQQIGSGIELIGRRRDGTEFPMELMLSPFESDHGILVTAAIRDVAARQADQDALRVSEEWHRMAVDVAEMGTWIWDLGSDLLTGSDRFQNMFGLTSDGPLSSDTLFQNIYESDRDELYRGARAAFERGEPFDVEFRVVWPDGSEHWMSTKGRVNRGPDGMSQSMQGTLLDITERRAGEESLRERPGLERTSAELMRSNADLQQFAYVAAHDLQEPLRMVSSYTQLLANRYRGRLDAQADEFIDFAVDGAQRMQLLIADLLAYCQVETAGQALRETSAAAALDLAIDNLQGAIAASGGVVTRDPLPILVADPAQLAQLFQNLVGNALKYRGADAPRVHVSARRNRAREWILSVRDNGLGIEPKYFARIFLMFQRLHAREAFSGTGIGLSLCRKIVERHGGRIWVTSEPNVGSTFYVALPEAGRADASATVDAAIGA